MKPLCRHSNCRQPIELYKDESHEEWIHTHSENRWCEVQVAEPERRAGEQPRAEGQSPTCGERYEMSRNAEFFCELPLNHTGEHGLERRTAKEDRRQQAGHCRCNRSGFGGPMARHYDERSGSDRRTRSVPSLAGSEGQASAHESHPLAESPTDVSVSPSDVSALGGSAKDEGAVHASSSPLGDTAPDSSSGRDVCNMGA